MRLFYDLGYEAVEAWLAERAEPRFRARQVCEWAYRRLAPDFDAMTNVPRRLRQALAAEFAVGPLQPQATEGDGHSTKLLLDLPGGGCVECVRVGMAEAHTACLSTQVGCGVRCVFCASGADGLERQLTCGEIVLQYVTLAVQVGPVSNLVFMGMGEPLHNYEAVVAAVRRFTDRRAFALSPRRVSIGTCGVVPRIRDLAEEELGVDLAISLGAPEDGLRARLMPGAARYPLAEVLAAAEAYAGRVGRPVTFAYVLLRGLNDGERHADALAALLRGRRHHLNVIPCNRVPGGAYEPPPGDVASAFVDRLRAHGLNASLRKSRGRSIQAACGQLRRRRRANC